MIKFSQLNEEIKEKRAVIAFGRFQPPHAGHSALIKHIHSFSGDKHIYVSGSHDNKENPLTGEERVSILKKMHPEHASSFHVASGDTSTIFKALSHAHKQGYKHVTVVAGPDRKKGYEDLINRYNGKVTGDFKEPAFHFKSWKVEAEEHRVGESGKSSGISGTKMRNAAISGDTETFRKGLHPNINDNDMHKIMHTIRSRLSTKLREEYIDGKIFKIGNIVEHEGNPEEIITLGTNYVTTMDTSGTIHRRWLSDVIISEQNINMKDIKPVFYGNQVRFHGYKTTKFSKPIQEEFKRLIAEDRTNSKFISNMKILILLKNTNTVLEEFERGITKNNYEKIRSAFECSGKHLQDLKSSTSHSYRNDIESKLHFYELMEGIKLSNADAMKAAKIIATAMDLPNIDSYKTPEDMVNAVARHSRTKKFSVDGWKIVGKMLNTATNAGIKWDKSIFPKPTQKAIDLI